MNLPVVNGLAVVRRQATGSRILLVRTLPGTAWVLPIAQNGESLVELVQAVNSDLFPRAELMRFADLIRQVPTRDGVVAFHLIGVDAELPAYFESARFVDARWASFDEARHILRGDLEEVLGWSRHMLHRVPLKSSARAA